MRDGLREFGFDFQGNRIEGQGLKYVGDVILGLQQIGGLRLNFQRCGVVSQGVGYLKDALFNNDKIKEIELNFMYNRMGVEAGSLIGEMVLSMK